MKKSFFALLGIGLCLAACSSDDNQQEKKPIIRERVYITYPNVTTTGENTFAFRVGESEFIAHTANEKLGSMGLIEFTTPLPPELSSSYYLDTDTQEYVMYIWAREQNNGEEEVRIHYRSDRPLQVGDQLEIASETAVGKATLEYKRYFQKKLEVYAAKAGMFKILKIDSEKNIISGTFEFEAEQRDEYLKLILATEGRFDIVYRTR
ncbi:hypothetical protein [Flavobacterium sp. NKUCC04_CG]|uniref:hypothetical protein n=1 Tax=Flavobacterium sp. NKUCC04_CG TaxID=2842121 RepID=UPI001C5B3E36|nr:hypothetical protein [Flavobacterium sp. NKUCC04_CG]MBW3520199.1 hypothetical protein [Flavobacterium sp. NKUCC04_CG]